MLGFHAIGEAALSELADGITASGWKAATFGIPSHPLGVVGFAPVAFGLPTYAEFVSVTGFMPAIFGTPDATPAGASYVFEDNFVDAVASLLSGHTSDSGHTWVAATGTDHPFDTDDVGLRVTSTSNTFNQSSYDVAIGDTIELTFTAPTAGTGTWRAGLGWDVSTDRKGLFISYSSTTGNTSLIHYNNTTSTSVLATVATSPTQLSGSYTLSITGNTATFNGVDYPFPGPEVGDGGAGLYVHSSNASGRNVELTKLTAASAGGGSPITVQVSGFAPAIFGIPSVGSIVTGFAPVAWGDPAILNRFKVRTLRPVRFGAPTIPYTATGQARGFKATKFANTLVPLVYIPE